MMVAGTAVVLGMEEGAGMVAMAGTAEAAAGMMAMAAHGIAMAGMVDGTEVGAGMRTKENFTAATDVSTCHASLSN